MHRTSRKHLPHPSRAATLAGRAGGFHCEHLEPRQLLSADFVYTGLEGSIRPPEAALFVDDYQGPVAAVGDIDGDGVTELLIGRAYSRTSAFWSLDYAGAALFSGKTGQKLRSYEAEGSTHYGWGVAALGDVDADGTPDYAITTGGRTTESTRANIYSGTTGAVLRAYDESVVGYKTRYIIGAGDVNGDDHADYFVSRLVGTTAGGDILSLVSGADGSVLRVLDPTNIVGIHAGRDFNGDEIPDVVVSTRTPGQVNHLIMYSGADGSTLFDVALFKTSSGVAIDSGPDYNGDGTADLLVTLGYDDAGPITRILGYSGKTGAALFKLEPPDQHGFGNATVIGDVNVDGIADIAVLGAGGQEEVQPLIYRNKPAAVYIYSGRDQSVIGKLGNDGDAFLNGQNRAGISGIRAVADLNGDGQGELIVAATDRYYSGSKYFPAHGVDTDRTMVFDGALLGTPVFDGTSVDARNNFVGWGHVGVGGFLFFRGKATYLKDLPGFSSTDRIVTFARHSGGYLIVAAPGGDQSKAFAWYGDFDLKNPKTYNFAAYGPSTADYTFKHITDAADGQVMLQYERVSDSRPAVFVFQLRAYRLEPLPGLFYAYDGVGVAIAAERSLAISPDDPNTTLFYDFGTSFTLEGFRAIDMRALPGGSSASIFPFELLGMAKRDGDVVERPYLYNTDMRQYIAFPLIEGGTDWQPTQITSDGTIVGTYRTAAGKSSAFLTRFVISADDPARRETVDVADGEVLGAPAGFDEAIPRVIGVRDDYGGPYEIYISYVGPDGIREARLADATYGGPYGSAPNASLVTSDEGSVVVTTNLAGNLLVYFRDTRTWLDLGTSYGGMLGTYSAPHFGDIVTWTTAGFANPSIALATTEGLILIEPVRISGTFAGERYDVRNLTTELAGSEAIVDSLLTFLPPSGLRIVGGLAADGDLVIYGLTAPQITAPEAQTSWNYGNLYDQVLRPFGLAEPTFNPGLDGDLIGYATSWNGLNIAGVNADTDRVVVFWTAPAILGWRFEAFAPSINPIHGEFDHLSVYLTPWGGINLVGGSQLNVYWWVPGQNWQLDRLTTSATGSGPILRAETTTTYVSSWGGLNVAGLDEQGRLWVYWWAPARAKWTAERLETPATDHLLPNPIDPSGLSLAPASRLASGVSKTGEFSIYARTPYGDVLRYFWSPSQPTWLVENTAVLV